MAEINQQQEVKDAVQAAVKSGIDVHQQIKGGFNSEVQS